MKLFKSITVAVLVVFGLSGCYTQLQYSQKMKRISDRESVGEYSWSGEEEARPNDARYDTTQGYYYDDDYVPLYYKDYETADFYSNCYCDTSKYYNDGYLDGFSDGVYAYNDFYYPSSYYGYYPSYYYGMYFGPFAFSHFRWGYDIRHPFFRPFLFSRSHFYAFYSPYYYGSWYGYPYSWYGYGYGHGYGYGYGYYGYYSPGSRRDSDRRYGPRSTGASRVRSAASARTRDGASRVNAASRSRAGTESVRTRSGSGSTRSRGTVGRSRTRSQGTGRVQSGSSRTRSGSGSAVGRTRSGSSSSGATRSRGNSVGSDRSGSRDGYVSRVGFSTLREWPHDVGRTVNRSAPNHFQNVRERNHRRSAPRTLWGRIRSALSGSDNSTRIRVDRGSSGNSVRSRGTNSSRVRSSSGTRSRSSSVGSSRSRSSSSSGSRSRSSGSRSGSSRSRGNN